MDPTATGVTEKEDREQGIDQQDIFYRISNNSPPSSDSHHDIPRPPVALVQADLYFTDVY